MINPDNPAIMKRRNDIVSTAGKVGLDTEFFPARNDIEIEQAFELIGQRNLKIVVVQNDPAFADRQNRVVGAAAHYRVAAVYGQKAYVAAGGLLSYAATRLEAYEEMATYVVRVLNGETHRNCRCSSPRNLS
jgi:putative ABC transport system substrate-binding protein